MANELKGRVRKKRKASCKTIHLSRKCFHCWYSCVGDCWKGNVIIGHNLTCSIDRAEHKDTTVHKYLTQNTNKQAPRDPALRSDSELQNDPKGFNLGLPSRRTADHGMLTRTRSVSTSQIVNSSSNRSDESSVCATATVGCATATATANFRSPSQSCISFWICATYAGVETDESQAEIDRNSIPGVAAAPPRKNYS